MMCVCVRAFFFFFVFVFVWGGVTMRMGVKGGIGRVRRHQKAHAGEGR